MPGVPRAGNEHVLRFDPNAAGVGYEIVTIRLSCLMAARRPKIPSRAELTRSAEPDDRVTRLAADCQAANGCRCATAWRSAICLEGRLTTGPHGDVTSASRRHTLIISEELMRRLQLIGFIAAALCGSASQATAQSWAFDYRPSAQPQRGLHPGSQAGFSKRPAWTAVKPHGSHGPR